MNQTYIPEETLETQIKNVKIGGLWEPETCTSRYKVAIIVPYRDRPKEKSYFLQHMHPFLHRQLLYYRVFIVEQVSIFIDYASTTGDLLIITYRVTKENFVYAVRPQ